MKFFIALFLTCLMKLSMAQNAVVIELFTSQGCSSCPAADKNLADIIENAEKNGQQVYGLSFHVDYWNYIGWKDPYSKKEFTERQRKYASVINPESIYTPQMIINGEHEFVGSDRKTSNDEVAKFLRQKMLYEISKVEVKKMNGKIQVFYSLDKFPEGQIVNIAVIEKNVANEVTRGENSGRKLAHRNVVRSFASAPAQKDGVIELPVPQETSKCQIIVFTQNREWRITGATRQNF